MTTKLCRPPHGYLEISIVFSDCQQTTEFWEGLAGIASRLLYWLPTIRLAISVPQGAAGSDSFSTIIGPPNLLHAQPVRSPMV